MPSRSDVLAFQPEFVQPRRVHQLAGGAVRLGVVVGDGAIVADDVLDEGGEGVDGEVLADADVEDAVGAASRRVSSGCSRTNRMASAKSPTCRNSRWGVPLPHSVTGASEPSGAAPFAS